MSYVIHGLKRSSVIHGIIGYAFTIFGLESSESVSASFKSETKFENEKKSENSPKKRAFIGCSTPTPVSPFYTIRNFYYCFGLKCMSSLSLKGQNLGSMSLLFARKGKNVSLNI